METADLGHHISRRFNEELERVRNRVLAMGGFVEQQLQKAVTALVEGDSTLGVAVAMDDQKVNHMEVTIDEECSRILATRAPTAVGLGITAEAPGRTGARCAGFGYHAGVAPGAASDRSPKRCGAVRAAAASAAGDQQRSAGLALEHAGFAAADAAVVSNQAVAGPGARLVVARTGHQNVDISAR